ncbi:uncharacterized protein [Ambystoma mexicanum]|uniref:uncharacterized protein n=1 Tax=Ambystoma mexicanum TaxID=8296 RepID=UPI0037E87AD8
MAVLLILALIVHVATAQANADLSPLDASGLCLQGPEYWCESEENALECMKEDYCLDLWQNSPAELFETSFGKNNENQETPEEEGMEIKRRNKGVSPKRGRGTVGKRGRGKGGRDIGRGGKRGGKGARGKGGRGKGGRGKGGRGKGKRGKGGRGKGGRGKGGRGKGGRGKGGRGKGGRGKGKDRKRGGGKGGGGGGRKSCPARTCTACKAILQKLKDLQDNKDEDEDKDNDETIDNAVDKVCSDVPEFIQKACSTVVEKFRDQIIEAAKEGKEPNTFCTEVDLCSQPEVTTLEKLDSLTVSEDCQQGPGFWCQSEETAVLCKKEDYCTELQSNLTLELEASGQEELGDSTEEEKRRRKKKNKKRRKKDKRKKKSKKRGKGKKSKKGKKRKDARDQQCRDCTQIVQNLQNSAGEEPDEDAINAALDSMCNDVGESIAETCTAMQENNRDALLQAVQNAADPTEVCTQIQMCAGKGIQASHGALVPARSISRACTICQAITSLVKPRLPDAAAQKDIIGVLSETCAEHFGNSTGCKDFLSTYGSEMKRVLTKPWDHITTCLEVSACDAVVLAEAARQVDLTRCLDGPSSWCHSMGTALHCKAVSYCVKVWRL